MDGSPAPVSLRLQPQQLPALRAAFTEALDNLQNAIARLGIEGHIPEPWLGDEISAETAAYYNDRVMGPEGTPYAALVAYQEELARIRDTLQSMEDHYRRTEGDNVAMWGRARG